MLLGDRIAWLLHPVSYLTGICKACRYRQALLNLWHLYAKQYGWWRAIRNFREVKRYLDEPR